MNKTELIARVAQIADLDKIAAAAPDADGNFTGTGYRLLVQ